MTKVPPAHSQGYPLIGNLLDYLHDPLDFMVSQAQRYGSVAPIDLGLMRFYLLSDPALVESVLVTQNRKFIKGAPMRSGARLLGSGLLVSEHDFWLRQRRLAQPAFHPARIAGYAQIMTAYTERLLDQWQDGITVDMHKAMLGLTMGVATRTLFNTDVKGVGSVTAALDTALDWWNKTFTLPAFLTNLPSPGRARFNRALQELDSLIYGIIEGRRRSGEDPGDLLGMLMAVQDEDGKGMTDQQLRDEVMTLFFAGHETTAAALTWTFYLLAKHPQVLARLQAELETVLHGRKPSVADLQHLRYTNQIIAESLRLFPPAWGIVREATEVVELGGYRFPQGTNFILSQYVSHRDPRHFPDPTAFRPERWTEAFTRSLPEYAYFPFGGGPRICIGKPFALMEAALVLATISQQYEAVLEPADQAVVPEAVIVLRPKGGLPMRLIRRRPQ